MRAITLLLHIYKHISPTQTAASRLILETIKLRHFQSHFAALQPFSFDGIDDTRVFGIFDAILWGRLPLKVKLFEIVF